MKKFTLLLWGCLLLAACSDPDDQLNIENQQADLTQIDQRSLQHQLDFVQFVEASQQLGGELTRMYYLFGNTYEDWYQGDAARRANTMWSKAYDLLPGIDQTLELDPTQELAKHQGVLKILKAYVLMTLVDYYGPIPFEGGWPADAQVAPGAEVYTRVLVLLDAAEEDLMQQAPDLENDVFYNNQFDLWSRLIGSIKLDLYTKTRLSDPNAQSEFDAIVASGNYIQSASHNFEFRYGSGQATPFDVHPIYLGDYGSSTGIRTYRSNYLMDLMLDWDDPRRRFYFRRQSDCTPGGTGLEGQACSTNLPTLFCSADSRPVHYTAQMSWCFVNHGYWGRDHGRSEGIPPDAFLRTAPGVYPVGGDFDEDSFLPIFETQNANGQGILPIVQSHAADWLQAEWALVNGGANLAQQFLLVASQKSIDRVLQSAQLDPELDASYLPEASQITSFMMDLADRFESAVALDDQWDILMQAKLIADYGNGNSQFNTYRRVGHPLELQYHLNVTSGAFPRSLYYPTEAVIQNPNLEQKTDLTQQVFWDTNPGYPAFPLAN